MRLEGWLQRVVSRGHPSRRRAKSAAAQDEVFVDASLPGTSGMRERFSPNRKGAGAQSRFNPCADAPGRAPYLGNAANGIRAIWFAEAGRAGSGFRRLRRWNLPSIAV